MWDAPSDAPITVLMTDVEGSTDLHTRLGDASARELIRGHEALIRAALAAHGGHEVKTMGDGFLAYFTSTRRALECAMAIQKQVMKENSLRVRIGLHCGEVIHERDDIHGAAVAAAARIMSQAAGGEIVVSDLVRQLAGAAGVQFRARVPVQLKGLEGEWLLHDVEWREGSGDEPERAAGVERGPAGSGLPVTLTSFVGRDDDRRMISKRLGESRLVMLTGPGGVGKTRLAIEMAQAAVDDSGGGVWFADLTSAADAAGVIRAVATALGVSDEPGRALAESVVEQLRDGPALLVLDNCEQALDAVAEFVTRLLGAAPRVRVLATSREALGVPGEILVAVAPLGTPAVADTAVGSVAECDAVRLFLARASAVHATFSLSEQNASAVASVCRRLDGIPLAIELAAAQLDVLEPSQLDALLEDRFALLQGPGRGRQERHRTLETMLASSYDGLDAVERATMDRLAVFRGTFSLEAVHAVAIDDPVTPVNVLDAVTALARKSLVVAVEAGGERRFRLLETMRHYAGQQLIAAGDVDTRRDRHFRWVLDLANRAGEGLAGPAQVHWFDALDDDLDNIEAALEWSLGDPTRAADALEAVLGLYSYWTARGTHRFQGVRWSEATATAATNLEPATRTQALMNGALLLLFSDLGAAADLADAARVLAGDDEHASAYATVAATFVAAFRGEHIDTTPIQRACNALSDDVSSRLWAEGGLALATASQGAFQEAYQQLIAVAQRSRDFGDHHMYGAWLSFGADLGAAVGDSEGARSEAFEALDISREAGCTSCESQALTGIALLGGGDELGGSVDTARRAVELAHGIREIFNVLAGLDVLAGALARQGRDDDAVTIAAATASLRTATGFASPFPGREGFAREGLELARGRMDRNAFDRLWRTGAALDYEHAVDYAIT